MIKTNDPGIEKAIRKALKHYDVDIEKEKLNASQVFGLMNFARRTVLEFIWEYNKILEIRGEK